MRRNNIQLIGCRAFVTQRHDLQLRRLDRIVDRHRDFIVAVYDDQQVPKIASAFQLQTLCFSVLLLLPLLFSFLPIPLSHASPGNKRDRFETLTHCAE